MGHGEHATTFVTHTERCARKPVLTMQKTSPESILYLPSFDPIPGGHGGHRRSYQILRLIGAAGFPVVRWKTSPVRGRIQRFARGLLNYYLQHGRLLLRRDVARYGSEVVDQASLRDTSIGLVIIENTRTLRITISLAKELGKRVMVLPQNLDSLYDWRRSRSGIRVSSSILADEIIALPTSRRCDLHCKGRAVASALRRD